MVIEDSCMIPVRDGLAQPYSGSTVTSKGAIRRGLDKANGSEGVKFLEMRQCRGGTEKIVMTNQMPQSQPSQPSPL